MTSERDFLCDRCGRCCRVHRVPITHVDLRRLAGASTLTPSMLVDFLPPEALDMSGEPETGVFLREGIRYLVLAHADEGCRFLTHEGCSIHAARPSACRSYPFDRPDPGQLHLGVVPGAMCPSETGYSSTLQTRPLTPVALDYSLTVSQRDSELSEYAKLVQAFNRRARVRLRLGRLPPGGGEFLEFLLRRRPVGT